jgi:hypothetical protein
MSSSERVRPSANECKRRTGRFDHNEPGRLSSNRVRKLLGERCTLDDTQIEELTDGLCALAEIAVTAFVEQRKQRKTVASEQSMPMLDASPVVAALART